MRRETRGQEADGKTGEGENCQSGIVGHGGNGSFFFLFFFLFLFPARNFKNEKNEIK